ncbi:MAG: hypothetical protein RL095_1158 [Verrucomicrobiota bacterium]|jgi:hypothetical protein
MIKSFLAVACLCLSAAAENPAAAPAVKTEVKAGAQFGAGAEAVYRKSAQAQGLDKLGQMKGFEMQSSFELVGLGLKGSCSLLCSPDKAQIQQSMANLKFVQVYDGKNAWSSDPMFGERQLEGAELFQLRQSTLKNLADNSSLWDKIELTDNKEFKGKACVTLKFSKKDIDDMILHLDKESLLPIGTEMHQVSPQGKEKIISEMSDYVQTPEGYRYASKLTCVTGGVTMKMSVTCEKRDQIDPSAFAKPAPPAVNLDQVIDAPLLEEALEEK